MAAARWTEGQREEALRLYLEVGTSEAARRTGIPKGTVASWARRAGVETRTVPPATEAAVEASSLVAEQRRLDLAAGMLTDVDKLRGRLFGAMTYHHVKTLAGPVGLGASTEVVEVDLDMPVPADQLRLVQAIGVLVDKVQLLTGQATERVDLTGEYDLEAELRAYQQGLADRATVKP